MKFPGIAAIALALGLAAACTPLPPRSDALFDRVALAMTRDDVRRIAGAPDEVMPFPLSRTESWDYFYMDTWGFYSAYSVTFGADGRVAAKMARRLNDGGDHGSP
jgi:outer membrane protein assembly factor BamE (lipoprotein component of BamABCDE complex)